MPDQPTTSSPARFEAGFAERPITPPVGTSLAGFFHDRVSNRVRDDLYARAAVLGDGDTRIALVALDLICVDADFADKAKDMVAAETGIPPDCVMISASHTHTGPEVRRFGNKVAINEEWLAALPRLIADAVAEASAGMARGTLRCGRVETGGYAFNRLFKLRNGKERMGQPRERGQVLGPAGPVDPDLQTLSFVDERGDTQGVIVNFGMHPVTVAGGEADFISADWPGEMARHLKGIYGDGMVAMFLQGSCGDINHKPYEPSLLPESGPEKTVRLGRGLAGAAAYAAERAEPATAKRLGALVRRVDIPYYTRTPELLAEVAELKQREKLTANQEFLVQEVESWPFDGRTCRVPLQALRIADLALLAIPAQIFTRIGLEMKHWSPARETMVIELANARVTSYAPTADQVERGAYGSRPIISRWLCADAGRRMIDATLVMLRDLWGETPS